MRPCGQEKFPVRQRQLSDPRLEGADVGCHTVLGGTEDESEVEWCADACWKLDNGFVDAYDPELAMDSGASRE